MLSKLPQIAKVGIELASKQANKKAGRKKPRLILIGQRTEEKQRKLDVQLTTSIPSIKHPCLGSLSFLRKNTSNK
jgi:hypothetical protein